MARPQRSRPRVLALLSAAAAVAPLVRAAIVDVFWDAACTIPQRVYTQDFYLGYCVGSMGMTACNAQLGWATFVIGSNGNDCPGNDLPALSATFTTTTCTPVFNWGYTVYYKLAPNPVCNAPGGVAPTAMGWFTGDKCENSTGQALRSLATGAEVFVWSTSPSQCYPNAWPNPGGGDWNATAVALDSATGSLTIKTYGQGPTCAGPVYSSYVNLSASGGCKPPTTGANIVTSGNVGASVELFPAPTLVTNTCPAGQSAVPGVASSLPTMAMLGSTPVVASGVRMVFYKDASCLSPLGSGGPAEFPLFGGFCQGGVAVTGCNAALGWATVNWHGANGCDSQPTSVTTLTTMTCTTVNNFGSTMYIKLASADCSAPATPPLMLGVYSDDKCAYGDFPVGGPAASISVPWTLERPIWPANCWPGYWPSNGLASRNSTSIALAADGSATIRIFGAGDATCSGPVYSSFVGVAAQAGDTQEAGKCTAATTGAANFAQTARGRSSGWVRLFRAPPAPFAAPNGARSAANRGAFINFFNDSTCRFPNWGVAGTGSGWMDAAHTITEGGYPIYAGYCAGGITVTGGNAAQDWVSTAWFVGNDCDTTPTTSVMLSSTACATFDNFGYTNYVRIAPSPDVSVPLQAPLEYVYFGEPTCTYQPYETPGVLGGYTYENPVFSQPYCYCGFAWDGNPNGPNWNCSTTAIDPVTRVVTVSMYNYKDCSGPVLSSWVMPTKGNTEYDGTCNGPTTGADRYQFPANNSRYRVFEQPAWPFAVATTAKSSALTGVKIQFFLWNAEQRVYLERRRPVSGRHGADDVQLRSRLGAGARLPGKRLRHGADLDLDLLDD